MRIGLTRLEALYIPFTQLLDLICIQQIKEEGFRYRAPRSNDEQMMDILSMR